MEIRLGGVIGWLGDLGRYLCMNVARTYTTCVWVCDICVIGLD